MRRRELRYDDVMDSHADHLPLIPAAAARAEIRVVNSRFLAQLLPTGDVAAARRAIADVRAALPDATHHVYAYVIGHGATTTLGMSDDGEPSGTAGRPVLAVLRGSGLGDATLVVTRWFGGTLLGTGGLVHAYGGAARAVLDVVERVPRIIRCTLLATLPYTCYELARRALQAADARIDDETFTDVVSVLFTLPERNAAGLTAALVELSAGRALIERLDG